MSDLEIIVTKPGVKSILVIDKNTKKVLLFATTYNKLIKPGIYNTKDEVVEILQKLATRGHNSKDFLLNSELIYKVAYQILASELPYEDKLRELYKYVRSQK